jgi:hypothetical protein
MMGGVFFRGSGHTHKYKEKKKYSKAAVVATSQEIVALGFGFCNEYNVGISVAP